MRGRRCRGAPGGDRPGTRAGPDEARIAIRMRRIPGGRKRPYLAISQIETGCLRELAPCPRCTRARPPGWNAPESSPCDRGWPEPRTLVVNHRPAPFGARVRSPRTCKGPRGLPADLRDPCGYPAEALRLVCGHPIRCDRFYLAEWHHIAPERERLERFCVRRNRAACALPCAPIRSLRFRMPCPEGAVELVGGDAQGS